MPLILPARPFDVQEHTFRSPQLQSLMFDAIRFFNGTPVLHMPPATRFPGSGVYAIYYTGDYLDYEKLSTVNRTSYRIPIYVGKAIPAGGRRGMRQALDSDESLYKRLKEHTKSITLTNAFDLRAGGRKRINIEDFACRFIIIPGNESGLIAPIEAALIKNYQPLWNAALDGFGNHDPGSGRYEQSPSPWDVLHPGRPWVERCTGDTPPIQGIFTGIREHLRKLDSLTADEVS